MASILSAWIGQVDLECSSGRRPGLGPTASVLAARPFDALVLLSDYGDRESRQYEKWLTEQESLPIHLLHQELADPTDYGAIHDAVIHCMDFVEEEYGADQDLAFHISPGTPAMQAVWVLLGKTRYPAELIQSHEKTGVRTASIPFDISAEYVPDVLRQPDKKLQRLSEGLPPEAPEFEEIIRRSPAMERAIARARRVAPRNLPVLIEGDSGTGKELFARAIHAASPRAGARFEPVNCGALPSELVESLLFGHERGAFTGAEKLHRGHFEVANGGTLFLDEIGELRRDAQVKLLRALQEGEIRRIRSEKVIVIDVRIIAATNRNLLELVATGRFREDLYHRIAVGVIRLPPIRERQGDLGPLIDHLLELVNREAATQPGYEEKKLSPSARNLLLRHAWPGNVRELQNTLLRLSLWTPGSVIGVENVREELLQARPASGLMGRPLGENLRLPDLVSELARHYLERAIEDADGNKTKAAELVGLPSYQTFTNWIDRYGAKAPKKSRSR